MASPGLLVHLPKPLWPPPWVPRLDSVQPDPLPHTHLFFCPFSPETGSDNMPLANERL